MVEQAYTEEWIAVKDLEVDRDVQRAVTDLAKVERIVKRYNEAALGVITVSRRNPVTNIVLDGEHRVEATNRKHGNERMLRCHVFTGLSPMQEAQMFLDLNAGNQPNAIDRFRVRLRGEDPIAIKIDKITKAYGWTVQGGGVNGTIQCVGTLEKIQKLSLEREAEPDLLQAALMLVTHAWGLEHGGALATVLEGLALVVDEYGSALKIDSLEQRLRNYPGGPEGLASDGKQIAAMKRRRPCMGVAERVVDEYNRGRTSNSLYPWRRTR